MALRTSPEVGGMGHSIKRKEDPRFIRGKGTYVDDVVLPGMLYLDIVRSSFAHGKIVKIDEALATLGVAGRDIQTTNVSIVPQRAPTQTGRPQPSPVVGYEVTNQVRVQVRSLPGLGRLLDTLVSEGANALGGIAFSIADPAPLLAQARTKAIADARQKAQGYAAAAGVKLGRVIFIRDATAGPPRPMGRVMAMADAPIAPGEQEIEVSVSVTYALE